MKEKWYRPDSNEISHSGNLYTTTWTRLTALLYKWFCQRQEWKCRSRNS